MLNYSKIKGSDLLPVMEALRKVLHDKEDNLAILGCISYAVAIQDPTLKGAKFVETVKTVSEYLALALDANYRTKETIN